MSELVPRPYRNPWHQAARRPRHDFQWAPRHPAAAVRKDSICASRSLPHGALKQFQQQVGGRRVRGPGIEEDLRASSPRSGRPRWNTGTRSAPMRLGGIGRGAMIQDLLDMLIGGDLHPHGLCL